MTIWSIISGLTVMWQLVTFPGQFIASTINYSEQYNTLDYNLNYQSSPVPLKMANDSLGVEVSAKSVIVFDWDSGHVLWTKNKDAVLSIASLTKLMTALVWLDYELPLDKVITVSEDDYREGGRFYIFKGEQIEAVDLLHSMLIASDNTAAIVLAKSLEISEEQFVQLMNAKAKQLGLDTATFAEPTGLSAQNMMSAADMYKLVRTAFNNKQIYNIVGKSSYSYNIINTGRQVRITNTNSLFDSYLNVLASKTGYSEEAGGCLVSIIENNNGQKLGVIIMGSADSFTRFQEVKSLAQWTFDNYIWPEINNL